MKMAKNLGIALVGGLLCTSANASVVRYGQANGTVDSGAPQQQVDISFAGRVKVLLSDANDTSGIMGGPLAGSTNAVLTDDAINGIGTELAATWSVNNTNGFMNNLVGSALGVFNGDTNAAPLFCTLTGTDAITVSFNKDVLVRHMAVHRGKTPGDWLGVAGSTVRATVGGVNHDFTSTTGTVGYDFSSLALAAGETIVFSAPSGAWSLKSLCVEDPTHTFVPVEPEVEAPANPMLIRYGQLTQVDTGPTPDAWVSFAGHLATNVTDAGTAGDAGTLHFKGVYASLNDTLSGSNLKLTVQEISSANPRLRSNGAGSVLGPDGGTNGRTDPGETYSVSFNQDVNVKYIRVHEDSTIIWGVGGVLSSNASDGKYLQINQTLSKGDFLTFGTDTGGVAWRLRSLAVETIAPPPRVPGFEGWVGDFELIGSDADPLYDYDDDGLENLLEYGLGGNPTNAALTGYSTEFSISGGVATYVYPSRTTVSNGLTYTVETTSDLVNGSWTNLGVTTLPETGVIDADFEAVTNQISTDIDARFIRLQIAQ